jgi:hypothetical protein
MVLRIIFACENMCEMVGILVCIPVSLQRHLEVLICLGLPRLRIVGYTYI